MRLNLHFGFLHTRKESSMERLHALVLDDTAASSVEYGLLLAGIAFVVFAAIMGVGQVVMTKLYAGALQLFQ